MKKAGKILSAFMAVMMTTSVASAFSISADAATAGGTVTVTSNVCDTVKCSYTEDSDKLTVTFDLKSDLWLLNQQSTLTYDSNVLKVSDSNTMETMMPEFSKNQSVINSKNPGFIYFNSTSPSLYDFKTSETFFTVDFDIIGGGDATVNLDVEVMTAMDTEDPTDISVGKQVKFVSGSEVVSDKFTFNASAKAETGFESDSIYIAAPFFSDGKQWEEMYFAYSSDANVSKVTKIPMEKTDLVYNMPGPVTGVITQNANLVIYKLTPTAAQAAAIDKATYTGFMNKTGAIRTNYVWSNAVARANINAEGYSNTKHTVEELKGKTFIINKSVDTKNKTSYLGYWTSKAPEEVVSTIYSASPIIDANTTMGTMYFRYGKSSTVKDSACIKMDKTDYLYTANNLSSSKLQAGEWVVYKLGLTQAQVDEINACNYTGFASEFGANYRTNFVYSNSVTRANIGKAGYGSAKHTMAELDGKMFFITGSTAANTVTYTGNWGDYDAHIKTVTLKVAVPTKVGSKAVTSMNILYSNECDTVTANKIKMTKTNESFKPDAVHTSLIASNATWVVYEAEIDANKCHELAKTKYVAFSSGDRAVRTLYSYGYNVLRAGVGSYESVYDVSITTHPENLDDRTFVICGSTSATKEYMLNGYWK